MLKERLPAGSNALPVVVRHEPECGVPKRDKRPTLDFLEAVLDIGYGSGGQEQRPRDFEQRRTFDGLYVSPQMTVVVSEIAEPAAPGVCFDFHWQSLAVRCPVCRSYLLQERVEGDVQ